MLNLEEKIFLNTLKSPCLALPGVSRFLLVYVLVWCVTTMMGFKRKKQPLKECLTDMSLCLCQTVIVAKQIFVNYEHLRV